MMTCKTCKLWQRTHTATPWFPPSSGTCSLEPPPWLTGLLEQLAPPYVERTTGEDDTCSFHTPGRVEEPTPPRPSAEA